MKLNNKIIKVLEDCDFCVNEVEKQGNDFYVELGQFTPCGEDWWETIWFDGTNKGFIEAVQNRHESFDVNEEVEVWIEHRGKDGIPSSIRKLVEDAEWKESMIEKIMYALEKQEMEEE